MKRLGLNTFVLSVGTVLSKMIMILLLPILTTYLSTYEYGLYDLYYNVIVLLFPLLTLQIQTGVYKEIFNNDDINYRIKVISTSFRFIIFSVLLSIFIFYIVNCFYKINSFVLLYLITYILFNYFLEITRGLKNNKLYSLASILNAFIFMILTIIMLVFLKKGLNSLLLSFAISFIIASIYLIINSKIYKLIKNNFDLKILKKLLKFSAPLIPNSVSWWIINLSDRLFIMFYLNINMIGIYAIANKIPSIYNLFNNAFNLAWQGEAIDNKDDHNYYQNIYKKLVPLFLKIQIILLLSIPLLFKILVNEKYVESLNYMPILLLGLLFSSISTFFGGIYIAKNNTKEIGLSTFVVAVINILINFIFIQKYHLYAASISTLVSYFILYFYRYLNLKYKYKYNFKFKVNYIDLIIFIVSFIIFYVKNYLLSSLLLIIYLFYLIFMYYDKFIDLVNSIIKKSTS